MDWKIAGSCELSSVTLEAATLWEVKLQHPAVGDFAIGLCLLWHDLVSQIVLAQSDDRQHLVFMRGTQPGSYPAVVSWQRDSAVLSLSPVELDMLQIFCLKAVRDGVAEVDHIDIEAESSTANGRRGDFVLKFPASASAVSEQKARRRLGISP